MILTNKQILDITSGLNEIENKESQNGTSIFANKTKVTFAIIKNKRVLQNASRDYEETVNKIIAEFDADGKTDIVENGKRVLPQYVAEWNQRMEELQSIEVDLEIKTITFDDIDGCPLSLQEMETLEFMIIE